MSCVLCHVSYVLRPVSCVMCLMSCVMCHVSCVLCLVSCVLRPVSCVLCLVSCVMCLMSCVLCPVSCVLCPLSCVQKKNPKKFLIKLNYSCILQRYREIDSKSPALQVLNIAFSAPTFFNQAGYLKIGRAFLR